jgi:hypothetical protein
LWWLIWLSLLSYLISDEFWMTHQEWSKTCSSRFNLPLFNCGKRCGETAGSSTFVLRTSQLKVSNDFSPLLNTSSVGFHFSEREIGLTIRARRKQSPGCLNPCAGLIWSMTAAVAGFAGEKMRDYEEALRGCEIVNRKCDPSSQVSAYISNDQNW